MTIPEILIYEDIGEQFDGLTPKAFAAMLQPHARAPEIDVRINSMGGSVFDGMTIYQQLARRKGRVNVYVDGAALSIAAVIAQSASLGRLTIADGAVMMVHRAWGFQMGNALEMREQANLLEKLDGQISKVLALRSGHEQSEVMDWMTAETWLDAQEAIAAGLADNVGEQLAQAAHGGREWLHMPERIAAHWDALRARRRIDAALRSP